MGTYIKIKYLSVLQNTDAWYLIYTENRKAVWIPKGKVLSRDDCQKQLVIEKWLWSKIQRTIKRKKVNRAHKDGSLCEQDREARV